MKIILSTPRIISGIKAENIDNGFPKLNAMEKPNGKEIEKRIRE